MSILRDAFAIVYLLLIAVFAIYGVHRYWLLFLYYKNKHKKPHPGASFEQLPRVTVQLPMYNEKYVAERLIDAVCAIRYPRELLEIQVLDDSTDETFDIVRKKVELVKAKGYDIVLLHRTDRTGYKAGALQDGLKASSGEFVAIFDADFIPAPNILEDTIHYFTDAKIGLVQSRWGHINRNYSMLTEIQSIFLDGHFTIEHGARSRSGRFFNFNGTAGVWRKKAILEAEGWQHDTLTEDLDLSYRAQLRGWRFIFVEDIISPAELPVDMNSFKSQQHHWTKGAIQTCLKLLPMIWRSKVPLKNKVEATFHLTCNFCHVLMVLLVMMIVPSMFMADSLAGFFKWLKPVPLFLLTVFPFALFYIAGQAEHVRGWIRKIVYVPIMIALGLGLILNNAKAVLEALFGYKTAFPRTPKYNLTDRATAERWRKSDYKVSRGVMSFVEIGAGLYFLFAGVIAVVLGALAVVPFMLTLSGGMLYVGVLSLIHNKAKAKRLKGRAARQSYRTAA